MHKLQRLILTASIVVLFQQAYADIPNTDQPITSLGPTLRGGITGLLTDTSGYSFAGEVAINNIRVSGNVGWNICDVHHLKFGGEYFGQRIVYPFFNGNRDLVQNQGAIGAAYEFDLNPLAPISPQFDFNAYYANAPSSPLNTQTGTFIDSAGVFHTYADTQRLAGSNLTGFSPGFSIKSWRGARIGIALNYDNLRYDMNYQPGVNVSGLGETFHIRQVLNHDISVGGLASFRKPFNNFQGDVGWYLPQCDGAWEFKLFGAYTVGKQSLPDSYNVGLSADYFLDRKPGTTLPEQAKQEFLAWMATPAVYIPEVLNITDESLVIS